NDHKIAKEILYRFSEIIPSVNREVGFYPDSSFVELRRTGMSGKITLILCHNKKEFNQYLEQAETLPEESIALAIPKRFQIIIQNPRTMPVNADFYTVLIHEYNHILLKIIGPNIFIPLWFNEGFAQYFAKQWNIKREFLFVTNALQGKLLDLNLYFYNYPEFQDQVEVFYLQSYYTIKYLINRFSKEKFQDFLEALHNSTNFEKTFFEIFEIPLNIFMIDAGKSIKTHAILTVFYSGFGLFWMILPLLLLIAYIRKRLLGKKVEEIWDKEENSDSNL
ncbi:MAG: hypothetical protein KAW87_06225, partial [Candidatus Cloacimonetes bacterium]|nr:hypothetical protein [Candidatus Cloacimonadota bacterium]